MRLASGELPHGRLQYGLAPADEQLSHGMLLSDQRLDLRLGLLQPGFCLGDELGGVGLGLLIILLCLVLLSGHFRFSDVIGLRRLRGLALADAQGPDLLEGRQDIAKRAPCGVSANLYRFEPFIPQSAQSSYVTMTFLLKGHVLERTSMRLAPVSM
jgi:hypothetical protein